MNTKILQRIDAKLERLNNHRPIDSIILKKIREQQKISMVYNSNAIEGNTLTEQETFWVLENGITVSGKPLQDHLEAKDHAQVIDWLYEIVDADSGVMTEHVIRSVHAMVLSSSKPEWAGSYRTGNVRIGGSKHIPPDMSQVPIDMRDLVDWFNTVGQTLHPIIAATQLHHKFVHIHPFFDGNGRTGRMLMNIVLMRAGYPLAVIQKNDRKKYYKVIIQADIGKYEPFVRLVAGAVEQSLETYLEVIDTVRAQEIQLTLKELSEEKNIEFSPKYLNLLARQGKLEAVKRGRLWYSSRDAVQRYLDNRERIRGKNKK